MTKRLVFRPLVLIAVAALASGCASRPPPIATTSASPSERSDEALASAAATLVCPSLAGRSFSLATSHGPARDAHATLLACDASAEGATIHAHAVLATWLGVSMEAVGARIDQYLHATVTVDARYALAASYVRGRLVTRLRPEGKSRVSVTPVGAVDVAATNWVALALEELAPARGTTPEWVAKDRIREVAERTLHEALDRELSVCLDVAHDGVAVGCDEESGSPAGATVRAVLWAAPHGTAFVGPFEASSSRAIRAEGDTSHAVGRVLCAEDLALVLARDRRGEDVPVGEWPALDAALRAPVGRACAWVFAVRVGEPVAHAVTLDVGPAKEGAGPAEARRWIGLHVRSAALVQGDTPTELWLESADEAMRVEEGATVAWVAELGEGESLHLRVRRPRRGAVVGEAVVPIEPSAAVEVRAGAAVLARVTVAARAVPAPRGAP
jgi:hypothetical protein